MKIIKCALVLFAFGIATSCCAAEAVSPGSVTRVTPGRASALVAAAVSLSGLVVGGLALARATGRIGAGNGRIGAIVALLFGLIGMVLSVVHLSKSTGGFGTGGGRAGAIVALVLGLIGTNLGGLALSRSRRSRRVPSPSRHE